MKDLAQDAGEHAGWALFADYCRLRGQGLRREAVSALDGFIAEAVVWPLAERVAFAVWVGERRQAYGGQPEVVLPVPLFRLLVQPTLNAWAEASPDDPWPWVWLARLSNGGSTWHAPAEPFLHEALARDPDFEPARVDFIHDVLRGAAYAQHELPSVYLGEAARDIEALERALALASGLASDLELDLRPRLVSARRAALDWLAGQGAG